MTKRWEAFVHLTRCLSRLDKGLIVETGCVRAKDDYEGAGASTLVWDWIAEQTKRGICVKSVDNNLAHVELARRLAPNSEIHCIDSIAWLRANTALLTECSLLYLDSYDHNPPYELSELHAMGELAAAYESLPKGCLIAVDDCNPDGTGKFGFIKLFFERANVLPEVKGYITAWRKP